MQEQTFFSLSHSLSERQFIKEASEIAFSFFFVMDFVLVRSDR